MYTKFWATPTFRCRRSVGRGACRNPLFYQWFLKVPGRCHGVPGPVFSATLLSMPRNVVLPMVYQGFQSSVRFPRWPPAGTSISCGAPAGILCFAKGFQRVPAGAMASRCLFFQTSGCSCPNPSFCNGFYRFPIFRKIYFF